jgi:CelD/BcsL family acetyltransferase involved in cellulose biosynthesis
MYVHRLGFDPAFFRYSPGLLLMFDVFERASAEGVELVEFLGAAETYKQPFVDRLEPLHEAIGLGRGLRGRGAGVHAAAIRLRSRLKRHERLRDTYVFGRATGRRAATRLRRES